MDKATVAVINAYAEVRGICQAVLRYPNNNGEKILAEHILGVMDRIVGPPIEQDD